MHRPPSVSRLIALAIFTAIIAVPFLLLFLVFARGHASELPARGPVPVMRAEMVRQQEMSVPVPIPSPRPRVETQDEATQPPERKAGLPKEERDCRAALTALGIAFTEQEPVQSEEGCEVSHPILIGELSRSVALQPEAVVNCTTALQLARFFTETVPTLARKHLGQSLKSVHHASAFVCRPRRGTQKLSEHAFANALDIASFTLADGSDLPVEAPEDPKNGEARFLDAFRAAACGPFKTVLGPGSDADHGDHFHLDMKARRNGYTFCQ
ncbi:extensin family protein [Nitratireductor sp. ZSWI3]|uniref:extensin-like domain-containing protein n=1 Tax=Nitratireductor sp. ZSWI3 TaxID=2966359 RepID=UPI00214FD13E|nr:extensin family protein [Nitratireductor sp. ZSWI3]MCR4268251.1 extensin family protein [Nitratireductor sp. ZSWI3]